jgi:hypothetical protein
MGGASFRSFWLDCCFCAEGNIEATDHGQLRRCPIPLDTGGSRECSGLAVING